MLFNSLIFLFAFLPVTYLVFWSLRSTRQRHIWLTITGYVFYGYWDPRFCLLMAFTTLVSYTAGRFLLEEQDPRAGWRQRMRERSAAGARADDDDVVAAHAQAGTAGLA